MRDNQSTDPIPNNELGMHRPSAQTQVPQKPTEPLDKDVQARQDAYNALSIGEALTRAQSQRGESKKEIARLNALLLKNGVNKKTTIGEARSK